MYRPDGPEELRPVGEVEFVQGIAAASATGLYGPTKAAAAIIGNADLALGDDVARVLDALQAASPNRFRGIRYNTGWDPHPELDSRSTEHKLADPQLRAGAKVLVRSRSGIRERGVLPPAFGPGGLRQRPPGPDHRVQPHRRFDPHRPPTATGTTR